MNIKSLLKRVAKEFDLKFEPKGKFNFLVLTKREIIIRNFLGGCPDPLYTKYGNRGKKGIERNLIKFLGTEDYKKYLDKTHACVISQKELKREIKFIPGIFDIRLRDEVERLYYKIKGKMGDSERLTLIWEFSRNKEKNQHRKEVILHEFVHELMENNGIRPKSWEWNEGLITYIANFAQGRHKQFESLLPQGKSKMWNIYARYAHEWARLFKDAKNPTERKMIILEKIKKLN